MTFEPPLLWALLSSILGTLLQVSVQASSVPNNSIPSLCPSPTGFENTIIRAPLPNSPTLQINPAFLSEHLLFFYTDKNTALSQAAFASFCLDQCIAYQPNPNVIELPADSTSLPDFFVTNKTGPCLSFTVDMGKLYPPNPNDVTPRWYCDAFDKYLAQDLSDFVPVDAPGSFMHSLGVNRACEGGYRAY